MGHDEEYIQQRIAAMIDWIIAHLPDGHEHKWLIFDDGIAMCSVCHIFGVVDEQTWEVVIP